MDNEIINFIENNLLGTDKACAIRRIESKFKLKTWQAEKVYTEWRRSWVGAKEKRLRF